MRLGQLFIATGVFWTVFGKECNEQRTTEENVTTLVPSLRTRTKAVKKGRKYKMETEYFEVFEEKLNQRNVTHYVTVCCHGYEKVNGKCNKHKTFVKPNAPVLGSMTSFVVPALMLLFMLAASIVVVYYLHSKDKLCSLVKRKNKAEKSSLKSSNIPNKDEMYTQIETTTEIVPGYYDSLQRPQIHVNTSHACQSQSNKEAEEDQRPGHHYDYLSIPSTSTK